MVCGAASLELVRPYTGLGAHCRRKSPRITRHAAARLPSGDEHSMSRTVIQPDSLKDPRPRYSQGIVTDGGRLLFIAGQTAADRDGNVVGKNDPEKQAEQVFANLGAVLAAAGGTFDNLVSTTTYLTDIKYREAYNKVRLKVLRQQPADQHARRRQGARWRRFPDRNRRDRRYLRRSRSMSHRTRAPRGEKSGMHASARRSRTSRSAWQPRGPSRAAHTPPAKRRCESPAGRAVTRRSLRTLSRQIGNRQCDDCRLQSFRSHQVGRPPGGHPPIPRA